MVFCRFEVHQTKCLRFSGGIWVTEGSSPQAIGGAATPAAFLHYRLSLFLFICRRGGGTRPVHISTFTQHILHIPFHSVEIKISQICYLLCDLSTASPVPLQIPSDSNMTQLNVRRKRSSASAATKDTVLPSNILTTSHLSALRDLVSEKKISGLHNINHTTSLNSLHHDAIKKHYLWREVDLDRVLFAHMSCCLCHSGFRWIQCKIISRPNIVFKKATIGFLFSTSNKLIYSQIDFKLSKLSVRRA